jgi:hypothetical protein
MPVQWTVNLLFLCHAAKEKHRDALIRTTCCTQCEALVKYHVILGAREGFRSCKNMFQLAFRPRVDENDVCSTSFLHFRLGRYVLGKRYRPVAFARYSGNSLEQYQLEKDRALGTEAGNVERLRFRNSVEYNVDSEG